MRLTEVRISLCGASGDAPTVAGRLRAFCSLTFDDTFVVRDVKLIEGYDGLFVAMPSRKLCDHCRRCGEKNHLRARFCNGCGGRLDDRRAANGSASSLGHGRPKLHADVAHPINASARHDLEREVVAAYQRELERSRQPGYVAPRLDLDEPFDAGHPFGARPCDKNETSREHEAVASH